MDYQTTSMLLDVSLATSAGKVEQFLLSNPPGFFTSSNKGSGDLIKGTPVAIHSSGTGFVAASAMSPSLNAYGIAAEDAPVGFAVTVLITGSFVINDWSQIIGSALLEPRANYFLSATAGKLTTIAPSTPGQIVQLVGVAMSPVALSVCCEPYILL